MNEPLAQLLERAARLQRDDQKVVACALVGARGSTPQSAGAIMIVDEHANTFGTIGGGCVEAEVRRRAFALMHDGKTGLLTFKLDHDYGWDDGLICGGTIQVAVASLPTADELEGIVQNIAHRRHTELPLDVQAEDGPARFIIDLPPRDRLYIAGAGHVGQALARLAIPLEFDVTMFDDRADLLERFAPAEAQRVVGDIDAKLVEANIDDRTYCVVVTRGHRHDERVLGVLAERGAKYVGMIGSRRKVKLVFDDLAEVGISREWLATVHAPIGLAINSETVEEIALSIAAELVAVRRADHVPAVRGPVRVTSNAE